jgi:hypothetical protein
MLRFLSPLWLAGFAALLVPLLLHLWNRRPTRVVQVGSLRGLSGPPGPRAFGRRLNDIPLLAIRIAVLGTVVLALAGLALPRRGVAAEQRQVLLVDPALLDDSLAVYADPLVDSLRRAGTPIHLLATGFPVLGSGTAASSDVSGVWALLRQLDDTLPPGSTVTVVAWPTSGGVGPMRPSLRSEFRFHRPNVPGADSPATATLSGGHPGLLADRPGDSVFVEVVVGQGFEGEAELAAAAWSAAIEASTVRSVQVNRRPVEAESGVSHPDVIIWLADQSVSNHVMEQVSTGSILVQVSAGEPGEAASPGIHLAASSDAPADQFQEAVFRRGTEPAGHPVLTDGGGQPVLTVTSHGRGRHYRLATRLGGDWSTLGLGTDLPELALLTLRQHQTGVAAAPVFLGQMLPHRREPAASGASEWSALTRWLILLSALLFSGERLLAHRRTWRAA